MKKVNFLVLAGFTALISIAASTHLNNCDKVITENRTVGKFSKIHVASIFYVEYSYSTQTSCVIIGEEKFVKRTTFGVMNDVLLIQLQSPNNCSNGGNVKIKLTGPEFRGADIGGVADFRLKGEFPTAPVELTLSGATEFSGKINATDFTGLFSGTADVDLSGQATKAEINVCGTVDLKAEEFTTPDLNINLSGTSSAKIRVTKALEAHATGVSSLMYSGNPGKIATTSEGLSTIQKL